MAKNKMSADEKQWRAEEDARVMKQMAEIQANKSRQSAALGVIKKEQAALAKVLGGKNGKR